MANVRPLVGSSTLGRPREIVSGDMIDPAVLPPSGSSIPTLMTANFTIAANTQVLYSRMIDLGSFMIDIGANAALEHVS